MGCLNRGSLRGRDCHKAHSVRIALGLWDGGGGHGLTGEVYSNLC